MQLQARQHTMVLSASQGLKEEPQSWYVPGRIQRENPNLVTRQNPEILRPQNTSTKLDDFAALNKNTTILLSLLCYYI